MINCPILELNLFSSLAPTLFLLSHWALSRLERKEGRKKNKIKMFEYTTMATTDGEGRGR